MKCPKCGYNSFEFHDSCKKCANDLTGYKETYGLKSIVLPLEARTSMAEALMAETALSEHSPEAVETPADMFSFDVPEGETITATTDDPFNFDDEPVASTQLGGEFSFGENQQSSQTKAEEDAFADLLESTSQKDESFLAPPAAPAPAATFGEIEQPDLTSFSWDDTSTDATASGAKPAEDDFNSLFGDMDDLTKK
jgi:hypothetical protein